MVSCAVASCKNVSGKISKIKDGITFHRFPRNENRRKQWEIAVNREAVWSSTTSSAVCSEHFDVGDFYLTDSGLRRLSLDAVPSLNISPCQEPQPTISKLAPADIKPDDSEEVTKLKHKVRRLQVIAEKRKRRLSLFWQHERRLKRKLEQMKKCIEQLVRHKESMKENGNR